MCINIENINNIIKNVIVKTEDNRLIILMITIGHRREVYGG